MRRIRTGRVALGAVAAALALVLGVFVGGAAQASTTAAGTVTVHTVAVHSMAAASVQGPSTTCFPYYNCQYNSGWVTYGQGGCQVETQVSYMEAPEEVTVTLFVYDPYWFASCAAYSTVWLGLTSGPPISVGPFRGFSCGIFDIFCSDAPWYTYSDLHPGLTVYNPLFSISVIDSA